MSCSRSANSSVLAVRSMLHIRAMVAKRPPVLEGLLRPPRRRRQVQNGRAHRRRTKASHYPQRYSHRRSAMANCLRRKTVAEADAKPPTWRQRRFGPGSIRSSTAFLPGEYRPLGRVGRWQETTSYRSHPYASRKNLGDDKGRRHRVDEGGRDASPGRRDFINFESEPMHAETHPVSPTARRRTSTAY
jgi:hypothetical protein